MGGSKIAFYYYTWRWTYQVGAWFLNKKNYIFLSKYFCHYIINTVLKELIYTCTMYIVIEFIVHIFLIILLTVIVCCVNLNTRDERFMYISLVRMIYSWPLWHARAHMHRQTYTKSILYSMICWYEIKILLFCCNTHLGTQFLTRLPSSGILEQTQPPPSPLAFPNVYLLSFILLKEEHFLVLVKLLINQIKPTYWIISFW